MNKNRPYNLAKTMEKLRDDGFVIIPKVYTKEECQLLTDSISTEVIDIIFSERGVDRSDLFGNDSDNLKLLTSAELRKHKLKDPNIIWRNGNSRTPILSKNCGIIDIHYNLDVLRLVTLDKRMHAFLSELYGTEKLYHLEGPERVSIKPRGSIDMPQHIDSNLFHSEVNYMHRIQALVCVSIDLKASENPNNCGTLCVLKNFHWYFSLASKLFHPTTGIKKFPKDTWNRYFLLPENFDKVYLPVLKDHIKGYTDYLHNKIVPSGELIKKLYQDLEKGRISVPKEIKPVEWTPVVCKPGDVICWNQYLPHRNLRNKLETPRIVCYYSVFPVESKDSKDKIKLERCKKMFENNVFYEQDDIVKNPEELNHIKLLKLGPKIQDLINKDSLSRKLCGYDSW